MHGTFENLYLKNIHLIGISCRVIPTQIIGRVTGDTVPFPSGDNCTHCSNTVHFHCDSPTTLSDNYQFDEKSSEIMLDRGRVYRWRYSSSDVPVLFVFPTNFQLNNTKLFYESGPLDDNTLLGFPNLTFYHVPNDFEIWNYSNLSQLELLMGVVQLGEYPHKPLRNSYGIFFDSLSIKLADTSTKKLLMVITFIEQGVNFSVSEIEFNVTSENSNCPPPQGNVINLGITITNVTFFRNGACRLWINHYLYSTWIHLSLR